LVTVRRSLALVAAIQVVIGGGVVSAQTVVVRNAPPNTTIEFVLNGSVTATATVGADGLATLPATKGALADRDMVDASVWVDECGSTRRVVVMNRVMQPPPGDGCRRTQVQTLFLLQRVSTILVDLETVTPTMRLRQGPLPDEWLRPPAPPGAPPVRISIAPRGAILFAGGENARFGDILGPACGDVTGCATGGRAFSFAGGLSFWFLQYVGAEAAYVRPRQMTAEGSGERFRFDNNVNGGVLVFSGKGGFPIGRVRLFGTLGAAYHRATFTTRQTIDEATIAGTSQIVPGGTTTLQWRTQGWAPAFGGGVEVWLSSSIGIFGEVSRLGLKGSDEDSEAETDVTINAIIVGGRYRLGGR
jgi:hypothetical protein